MIKKKYFHIFIILWLAAIDITAQWTSFAAENLKTIHSNNQIQFTSSVIDTLISTAIGSTVPPQDPSGGDVMNGDFLIERSGGNIVTGNGIDEITRWGLTFSSTGIFSNSQVLSAQLTLTITPMDQGASNDHTKINDCGCTPINVGTHPINVPYTIQFEMLNQGYLSQLFIDLITMDGGFQMFYQDDAIVSFAELRLIIVSPSFSIDAPQAGEFWITGEQDTIKWSGGNGIDSVKIELSENDGITYKNIATVKTDNQQYVWTIPKALSTKCKIKISDKMNGSNFKVSERFKIKGYELTRYTASGDYERFRPEIHGWSFENVESKIWPLDWWQQFDYHGIDPNTNKPYLDSWSEWPVEASFDNFPDWPLFVQTFGTNQCYFSTSLPIYNPIAFTVWALIKKHWNGSCHGLAVSSLAAFEFPQEFINYFNLPNFQNLFTVGIDILPRLAVNQSWTAQFGIQEQVNHLNAFQSPNTTLAEIKAMLINEDRDKRVLLFYENGVNNFGRGGFAVAGHSILPYKIESDPVDTTKKYVYVYDNNYAADTTRKITFLTAVNGWEYTNMGWDGDDNIFLSIPVSNYLSHPTLSSPLNSRKNFNKLLASGKITIYNTASSNISIYNSNNDSIGFSSSKLYNTFKDAYPLLPLTSVNEHPMGFVLPTGNYSVRIDSSKEKNPFFAFITDSLLMMYGREDADSTQTDNLSFGDGLLLETKDIGNKAVNIRTIFIGQNFQKMFDILNCNLSKDDLLEIKKINSDDLMIKNSGLPKIYNLNLELASGTENPKYSYEQIHLPLNSTHRISPDWNDLSKPLIILEDIGNDGTINDTLIVNDNSNPTLPVELISFSASPEKEGISLKWKTATEINNNGFEIERTSTPLGMNWEKIGFVKGAGSTVERSDYSYLDKTAPSAKLKYRLKQIDYSGSFEYSNVIEVDNETKLNYDLAQNYPNPFNPVTIIKYTIPENTKVRVIVYDVIGQTVAVLVNENQEKGIYKVDFDGSNLNSGIYFYQLVADNKIVTRKMTLIK